jgi:sulfur carrier protein
VRLEVNGSEREVEAGITLSDLLAGFGLSGAHRVAVSVNGDLVRRQDHARRRLQEGDRVDVIHAVAGG